MGDDAGTSAWSAAAAALAAKRSARCGDDDAMPPLTINQEPERLDPRRLSHASTGPSWACRGDQDHPVSKPLRATPATQVAAGRINRTSIAIYNGIGQPVTLVRLPAVRAGASDWAVGARQWRVLPANDFSDLGLHDYFWQCTP